MTENNSTELKLNQNNSKRDPNHLSKVFETDQNNVDTGKKFFKNGNVSHFTLDNSNIIQNESYDFVSESENQNFVRNIEQTKFKMSKKMSFTESNESKNANDDNLAGKKHFPKNGSSFKENINDSNNNTATHKKTFNNQNATSVEHLQRPSSRLYYY